MRFAYDNSFFLSFYCVNPHRNMYFPVAMTGDMEDKSKKNFTPIESGLTDLDGRDDG